MTAHPWSLDVLTGLAPIDVAFWADTYVRCLLTSDHARGTERAMLPPHVQDLLDWLAREFPGCELEEGPAKALESRSWTIHLPETGASGRIRITQEAIDRPQNLPRQFRAQLSLIGSFWRGRVLELIDMSDDLRFQLPTVKG